MERSITPGKIYIMRNTVIILIFVLFGCVSYAQQKNVAENKSKASTQQKSYPSLKAILILGPVEELTPTSTGSMDEMVAFFHSKGVETSCFYNKDADWAKIRTASKLANFFIYAGHGSNMGEGGKSGGLCLNEMISSKQIIDELHLRPNAMVIFHTVCRSAGSSASDKGDIGIQEAIIRVTDYSGPFFKIGASCYYSSNMVGGCVGFFMDFFAGKTLRQCYESSAKFAAEIEISQPYRHDKNKQISIASTDWEGTIQVTTRSNGVETVNKTPATKQYNIAYVGNPDFTLKDLMK